MKHINSYLPELVFGTGVLVLLVVLALVVKYAPSRLQPSSVELYRWQNSTEDGVVFAGDEGVKVVVKLPGTIHHDPAILDVSLPHSVRDSWQVRSVIGYEDGKITDIAPIHYDGRVYWNRLRSGQEYELHLLLHGTGDVDKCIAELRVSYYVREISKP